MAVLLLLVVMATSSGAQLPGPVVTTRYGKIQGLYSGSAAVFHGVPYASPPVGPLRWETPADPLPWGNEVYNATEVRPACPQVHCEDLSPPLVCPKKTAEDCLYLEIFTPRGPPANSSGWPVMVYMHGGNFEHMSGASPLFDGRTLASTKDVVQVNMNYRVGALGFLVTGETSRDARGNYGILDQQQALKWVTENIKAFGGDNARITLFGQSAGAQSTLLHLTLLSSAPYFHRAIIESTPIAIPYKRFPEAILLGELFAELAGCAYRDMNCLRSKTANEIATAQFRARKKVSSLKLLEFFEPWGPFVDGELIKGEPLEMVKAGQFQQKPLIIGTTSEETVLYVYSAWNNSVNDLKYGEVVAATYPGHVVKILYMYPPSYPTDERDEMVRMSTDLVFACPTRNATRIMRSHGNNNIWVYVWDHAFSFPGWGQVFFCEGRVCHGSEIVYLFHTEKAGNYTFTREEEVISKEIMDFWTNFAKTGDPNNPGFEKQTGTRSKEIALTRTMSQNDPKVLANELEVESTYLKGDESANLKTLPHDVPKDLQYRSELFNVLGNGRLVRERSAQAGEPRQHRLQQDEKRHYHQEHQPQLHWPAYSPEGNWPAYRFKTPASYIDTKYHGPYCDFWDTIGYEA